MPPPERLRRFTRTETRVHRTTSALALTLLATGIVLYVPALSVLVGRRSLLASVHVLCGFALPFPMLLGLLTSPELRADVHALGRFLGDDAEWLRRGDRRRAQLRVGKFNAGQKLAAALFLTAGAVLLVSGLVLVAPLGLDVPDSIRQGATFVHDVVTFALLALLLGHVWQAWRHPEARAALRTGAIDREYAAREHPEWVAEQQPVDR
jgi:formate dehydrogenase subunit gamma